MIKKIQIRGISRTPSDQLNVDGGCDESLNVQLTDTEVVPMFAPADIMDAEELPDGAFIYIHKFEGHTNYVFLDGQEICATTGNGISDIVEMEEGETVVSVTSVGRTLIVYGSVNTYYATWKDGAYIYLGTKIPEPVVKYSVGTSSQTYEFTADSAIVQSAVPGLGNETSVAKVLLSCLSVSDIDELYEAFKTGSIYKTIQIGGVDLDIQDESRSAWALVSDFIWAKINEMQIKNQEDKFFITPVFIRTAVRLYDGSYIYHSVPFLLGNGRNQFVELTRRKGTESNDQTTVTLTLNRIAATAQVAWDVGNWKDVIQSVDFALSTDIANPKWNDPIKKLVPTTDDTGEYCSGRFLFSEQKGWQNFEDVKDEVLSKVNFYKVHSISAEEVANAGGPILWNVEPKSQDELVVQQVLPDSSMPPHTYTALNGATSYNMRTIMSGVKTTLSSGYPALQGTVMRTRLGDLYFWAIKYFVRTGSGDTKTVLGRNSAGRMEIWNTDFGGDNPDALAIIMYPDPRCYKVEIYDSRSNKIYSVPMKEHPGLNCAYALCDLSAPITSIGVEISSMSNTEERTFTEENVLMMSEAENPFSYGILNRKTFGGKILGVAPTTMALSTETFGRYPLYVFSSEGVDAVGVNEDGSFGSIGHISRDVAIEGTVKAIDKAIVFATDRGVMLLTEKGVDCISPYMNGRHIKLEEAVVELLAKTEWADFVPESFMAFIKKSRPAYDYPGSRLIFFNPDKAYQYVYSILSRSWHKMLPDKNFQFGTVLNSYPECLVTGLTEGSYRVMDFSTHLDASLEDDEDPENDQAVLPGIIKTRTISLDADNLYKGIRSIRIRGDFKVGAVKYILLASHDGKEFRVLHSLRGPSWKYYKLVLLSRMRPNDRIAYVEFDLNERFTDKIR